MTAKTRLNSLVTTLAFLLGGVTLPLSALGGKTEDQKTAAKSGLAACLKQKKFVMYGAHWCGFCKKQKNLFGESASELSYVECTQQEALCAQKKINGYPTWIDAQEKQYSGMQSLETLAKLSGCPAT